jgi:hypothetical protein
MKRKILLLSATALVACSVNAQIKAYAITGVQKGKTSWTEVRQVDVTTGDEIKSIYQSASEIETLNARTGKPTVKKDATATAELQKTPMNITAPAAPVNPDNNVIIIRQDGNGKTIVRRSVNTYVCATAFKSVVKTDAPFSTTSAALAYDKKHDRLYYTPMGIAELRYIDMKSKTTKIYYFEDEKFGVVSGRGDVTNQITRMVIAADGKGYALTNNADHLISFETDKKPVITDLGALNDDPANGNYSVHRMSNSGGDIIADAFGDLYLIGGNRAVYKITMKTLTATYKGSIKGLPAGFTTNGACVEENGKSSVIVCSSNSPIGYFRFDLNTLQAEKVSTSETVFNASDLANGNLAFSKKNPPKEEEPVKDIKQVDPQDDPVTEPEPTKTTTPTVAEKKPTQTVADGQGTITVYPNPVTTGVTRLSFKDLTAGKYQVQVMDINGKLLSNNAVTITSKLQVEELKLPAFIAKGNYLVKVVNEKNEVVSANPIIVQ